MADRVPLDLALLVNRSMSMQGMKWADGPEGTHQLRQRSRLVGPGRGPAVLPRLRGGSRLRLPSDCGGIGASCTEWRVCAGPTFDPRTRAPAAVPATAPARPASPASRWASAASPAPSAPASGWPAPAARRPRPAWPSARPAAAPTSASPATPISTRPSTSPSARCRWPSRRWPGSSPPPTPTVAPRWCRR